MPCIKCKNGKWKYGVRGRCQFTSLEKCKEAERAIHANDNKKNRNNMNKDSIKR